MINLTSNVKDVLGYMARFDKQYRFAVAKALTDTAKDVQKAMPAKIEQDLDRPNPYTKTGFYATPANKATLTAAVGVKDRQAEYLQWQVFGGVKRPEKKRLKLPSEVQVDVYGNIPRGLVRQLVRRAEQGKGVTKRLGLKAGISQDAGLFYGKPKGSTLPVGLWKRENGKLTPVIVFPERTAKYTKRFDFFGEATRLVRAEFPARMRAAWELAKATAK